MKVLVAVDHSEASKAVLKEVAARPWPIRTCVEVLNVVEPTHMWTVSQTAEEAIRLSSDLVTSRSRRAAGLGSGSGRRVPQGRCQADDPGPG